MPCHALQLETGKPIISFFAVVNVRDWLGAGADDGVQPASGSSTQAWLQRQRCALTGDTEKSYQALALLSQSTGLLES